MAEIAAIHLGASSLDASIVSVDGELLTHQYEVVPSNKRRSQTYKQLLNEIVTSFESLAASFEPSCLVLTTPIPIDSKRGFVGLAPAMPGMQDRPLQKDVQAEIRALIGKELPVFIENDANAAALRSRKFGHSRGLSDFVHLRVSTGLGGCIILNEQFYGGQNNLAGEIGHMVLQPHGIRCGCGNKGCAETVVGGHALITALHRQDPAKSYPHFTDAIRAAEQGDHLVRAELEVMGTYLGLVVASTANILNPAGICMSGPVFDSTGVLLERTKNEFLRRVCVGLECEISFDRFEEDGHAKSCLAVYEYRK